jgi:hypothetical protein
MPILRAERPIAAPPRAVWRTITDFRSYPEWNPFITFIGGEARAGTQLTVHIRPPGRRTRAFKPVVKMAEPDREFVWLARFLIPGLLDREHHLRIERADGASVFVQEEVLTGPLTPVCRKDLEAMKRGFEEMNTALKYRVERPRL